MSRWFSRKELACRCPRPDCPVDGIDPRFAEWLDTLRDALGRPVTLTSAFRCPLHDSAIGGKGPHTTGFAADIAAVGGSAKHEVVKAAMALGVMGLGVGSTFVHCDLLEPSDRYPRPVIWTYPTRRMV